MVAPPIDACANNRSLDGADRLIACNIYNVKTEFFFDYDQSGRRGHSKKLFKRSSLDIKKFAFSNKIVDRWNSLSECCVMETYKMRKCENAKVVMYRLRMSKNVEASAKVRVKCESAKVT